MTTHTKTLQERLAARTIRRPPAIVYLALANIWKALFIKKLGVRFEYRIDLRDYRDGPYIVVSNHASRLDYIYAGIAFLPHRLNWVAGYNEFFRSHLAFVFRLLQVIPKRNFTPDVYAIRQFSRIIRGGGKVIIFPEGMSSIGGSNQPCALGSGNLLKHFGVPVLMTKIKGGYLTNTKYCLDERPGRVDVVVDLLFSPEDLERMSADEVQLALDRAIRQDDYAWNKVERVRFGGKGRMAHNLHHLLYWCPRCGAEFTMRGEGDELRCSACGNGARLNEYYDLEPLDPSCVIPETPRVWFDLERARAREQVAADGFSLTERVRLGVLPRYEYLRDQKTSEIVGEGELRLDRGGLTYGGTKDGEPFGFHLNPDQVPTYGMCTDVTFFYTFHRNDYYEFRPETESTAKWLLCTEEIHRLTGGAWKDFPEGR
ncbi:MAG TPA: 1-acyl-sn-glycerol-3-phosphate acyltransferase [Spirochaetales bacterium]|nr:1-acyl-sn-glycerol-3-phosphate acyltransferase [Spirochaetales bacterium]